MKKRQLFYIYSYRNGMKHRNVGFLECKTKDSKYKFNLSIKIPQEYVAENMNICLYKLNNGVINELKLGTLNPLNETCKFSTSVDSKQLKDNGFSIDDISGMYIFSNEYDRYVFLAEMDEQYVADYRVRYV